MSGRGAWAVSGKGGTLNVDARTPGPYYVLSRPGTPRVGDSRGDHPDANVRAVRAGVLAFQLALNRRLSTQGKPTGIFDPDTMQQVVRFQLRHMPGESDWGGIGPETAKAIFLPDVKARSINSAGFTDWQLVCGIISSESMFDPGAVGFTDEDDLGLAQINGRSHPDMPEKTRLQPLPTFTFVAEYLKAAFKTFGGNERDAIASYNLGAGGTRSWIKAGRPDIWTPVGSVTPRDVDAYITKIRTACADSA